MRYEKDITRQLLTQREARGIEIVAEYWMECSEPVWRLRFFADDTDMEDVSIFFTQDRLWERADDLCAENVAKWIEQDIRDRRAEQLMEMERE